MEEKKPKIFADGIRFDAPSLKAPEWIKGKISVNVKKFTDFMADHMTERGWLVLDVKESKNGTIYIELNTYKKQ